MIDFNLGRQYAWEGVSALAPHPRPHPPGMLLSTQILFD